MQTRAKFRVPHCRFGFNHRNIRSPNILGQKNSDLSNNFIFFSPVIAISFILSEKFPISIGNPPFGSNFELQKVFKKTIKKLKKKLYLSN